MRNRAVVGAVLAAAALWFPSMAQARTSVDYAYRFEQVWSASIRMVRVDLGLPIQDRDESIGFMLFDYTDHGRTYPGSIELVRTTKNERPHIRVVVQIPSMPSYHENMLLDRLGRKLRDEFGEPPEPPRTPRRGADDGEDDDRDRHDRDRDDRDRRDPDGDDRDRNDQDRDGRDQRDRDRNDRDEDRPRGR